MPHRARRQIAVQPPPALGLYLYFTMRLSRRHFFFGSLALPALAAKKTAPERPSVVLLIADNLPQWVLGSSGNQEIRTPNLDRLAQVATRFRNHFTAAPAPAPGRATLMTGHAPMRAAAADPSLEKALAAAGYVCNSTEAINAARHIEGATPGKPFFLTVNLSSPRAPYDGIAQKYHDLYAQTKFDTFSPDPAAANARAGKEMLADTIGSLRKYAAAVTALDDEVQSVLSKIAQRKLVDQTLVIFTSTCGALLGHHGLWDAGEASDPVNMFEEAVSTPMMWSWPLRVPPQIARPEVVSAYDLAPSLCEVLGVEAPAGNLCGRSYSLLVTGKPLPKKERWRTTVFAQLANTWMARAERYKLVVRDGGPGELYDLQADKEEKVNQFDNQQFVTVKTQLSTELAAWRQKFS
jgi:arylsulfatase A-like enzyme